MPEVLNCLQKNNY